MDSQIRTRKMGSQDGYAYTAFVRAVARACGSAAPPPVTTAESLAALRMVFAAYRAAESGQAQPVRPPG